MPVRRGLVMRGPGTEQACHSRKATGARATHRVARAPVTSELLARPRLGQPAVQGRQPRRQGLDVADDLVADVTAHLAEVVVPFFVDREGEGDDALVLCLYQGLVGVVHRVFLLGAVAA